MPPHMYTPLILAYCAEQGIDVPPPFARHPANRFVVIRLDSNPPKLSAKTFFKKEDLHYYLRAKVTELRVADATALPLRVLDFKEQVVLDVDAMGNTHHGTSFIAPREPSDG